MIEWVRRALLLMTLICAPVAVSASLNPSYIRLHYPRSVQSILLRENAFDDECRGSYNGASTERACAARDRMLPTIKAMGWCWGSTDPDASEADMTWLPCARDRSDTAHMTPFQEADARLNASYHRLMAHYGPEGRTAVRDAQRAWLTNRNRDCGPEAQNSCATHLTERRTAELDQQLGAK